MTEQKNPRPPRQRQERDLSQDSIDNDFTLRDEWDKDADQVLDEFELRPKPAWLEAIGDEDEAITVEQSIREDGFELMGEDDFVSDPTAASDMPDWVDDDYDDTLQDKLEERQDEMARHNDDKDETFYST